MSKYTEWFPGDVKPTKKGVFQNGNDETYQYWGGRFWGRAASSPYFAFVMRKHKSLFQSDRWRGLAQDTKVKK